MSTPSAIDDDRHERRREVGDAGARSDRLGDADEPGGSGHQDPEGREEDHLGWHRPRRRSSIQSTTGATTSAPKKPLTDGPSRNAPSCCAP